MSLWDERNWCECSGGTGVDPTIYSPIPSHPYNLFCDCSKCVRSPKVFKKEYWDEVSPSIEYNYGLVNPGFLEGIVTGKLKRPGILFPVLGYTWKVCDKLTEYIHKYIDKDAKIEKKQSELTYVVNGTRVLLFSCYEPDKFCGPQFDGFWIYDAEACEKKPRFKEAIDNIGFCLRLDPCILYKDSYSIAPSSSYLDGKVLTRMGKYDYLIEQDLKRIEENRKAREIKKVQNIHQQELNDMIEACSRSVDIGKVCLLHLLGLVCFGLGWFQILEASVCVWAKGSSLLTNSELLLGLTTFVLSIMMLMFGKAGLKTFEVN